MDAEDDSCSDTDTASAVVADAAVDGEVPAETLDDDVAGEDLAAADSAGLSDRRPDDGVVLVMVVVVVVVVDAAADDGGDDE